MSFTKADFVKIEDQVAAEGLFKLGVLHHIEKSEGSEGLTTELKEALSIKHQVLCDETAIIGVLQ